MEGEIEKVEKNDTWTLVTWSKEEKNVISTKWVYKNKMNEDGEVMRNNVRLI